MKLKNNALQELYDTLVNSTITFSPYVDSPVDKAFRECDEKLSESVTFEEIKRFQSDNDILTRSNDALLSANMEAISKNRKLEKEVEDLKKAKLHLEQSRLGWVNRANKSVEEFNLANKEITELKNRLDKANADRTERENEAIRELVDVRSQLNYCTHSRDNWRSRAKYAEDEVKKLNETLEKANADRTELQKDRDSYHGLYTELRKDYDKLFEDNRKLKAWTDCHRYEVEWYRKHYKEQSDKIRELKSRFNSIPVNATAFSQGQKDLWDMLQNVNDINAEEFDVECHSTNDIVSMDLEDFLDAYKKWQEEKEKDRLNHMRDYLDRFCRGKDCSKCPLGSMEFKCGRGYGFARFGDNDDLIVPDEDLPRYYEKATGSGRYKQKPISTDIASTYPSLNTVCGVKPEKEEKKSKPGELVITTRGVTTANYTEATMNAIKEAVRKLEKSLPALDSWEATITGSIKADDILGKTNDTEHKLEYGDAVRLPRRDYDYMYIGPYEESKTLVRMFDPKMHAMVISHIGNVKYNGGKIIICDEDDLRKIWKDKK